MLRSGNSRRGPAPIDPDPRLKILTTKFYILAILVLAITVRIYGVLSHPALPVADAADYHRLATGLVQGRGYVNEAGASTAWRPPAYPVFLAGVYKIFGVNVTAVTIVQALLGGLTVLMLMFLGALILGWPRALIAGVIAAVYPVFIWLPRLLLSENLSLFLLLLTLVAIVMYLRTSRLIWIVVFGVFCAVNTLVRGSNLFVPLAVACALLIIRWRSRSVNWNQLVAPLLVLAVSFILPFIPWTIRNYYVFHHAIPIATQDGLTLYGSYWPPQKNGKLIWGSLPETGDPAIVAAAQTGDEVSASRYLNNLTRQRLRENPGYFFRLIPSKLLSLLAPLDWEVFPHARGTTRTLNVAYLLILLPALFGFIVIFRERVRHQWLLWLIPVMVLFQSMAFYGSPRFRLPAELIALLPTAVGVSTMWQFLKQRVRL
jgi:4-amino-4-deoxy-L-arabinose transferase-like glycosyltransferase